MFAHLSEREILEKVLSALHHLIEAQEKQNHLLHRLVQLLETPQRATSAIQLTVKD